MSEWYRSFFEDLYPERYTEVQRLDEAAPAEVDFIVQTLELQPDARILDLCCGHGRHSLELARRGFSVVGQDLSAKALGWARERAKAEGLVVEFINSDMRNVPFENEFDAVLNLFTAWGYFETDEDDEKVFGQVAKAVKPSGKFVLEVVNRDAILAGYHPQAWQEFPGGPINLAQREFDQWTSRNRERVISLQDGRRQEYDTIVRLYSLHELAAMLRRQRLEPLQVWGGLDGQQFELRRTRIVLLSQKIA